MTSNAIMLLYSSYANTEAVTATRRTQHPCCLKCNCRTGRPRPTRSTRLRLVGSLAWVAAVTAFSSIVPLDSCFAFSRYHHQILTFQRSSTSRTREPMLCDPTTMAGKKRLQHDVHSTRPQNIASNYLQKVNLHRSSNNNNNQIKAALSPDITATTASNITCFSDEALLEETLSEKMSHHQYAVDIPPTKENMTVHDHLTLTDKLVVAATTLVGIGAFCILIIASGPGAWRFYLSGGVCAATSHAIPTPIDVVKTRKQVDPALRDKNFIEASTEIVQKEGVRALLAGLGPTTWGYLLEGAVKFGVYENLKPSLTRMVTTMAGYSTLLSFMDSQVFAFMLCGAISGAAAAIALCPMEALRIRLVAEPKFAPKGWLQGGYKILKYEGVSGLWKGMTPMLYKQVPYTVMKNVSFDLLTRLFYALIRTGGYAVNSTTKFTIPFFSAMIASVLSCISSQPGDMLLSLVNAHEGKRRTTDFIQDILQSDQGFRGFFVGTKTRLLHVGMIVTLQLLIYDFVKRLCGIAATGSV